MLLGLAKVADLSLSLHGGRVLYFVYIPYKEGVAFTCSWSSCVGVEGRGSRVGREGRITMIHIMGTHTSEKGKGGVREGGEGPDT